MSRIDLLSKFDRSYYRINFVYGEGRKKRVAPFWDTLLKSLQAQLEKAEDPQESIIKRTEACLKLCQKALRKMDDEIKHHRFETDEDEINFFKVVKPELFHHLVFYHRIFAIELNKPTLETRAQIKYLEKELQQINEFFESFRFYYHYLRTGKTNLDDRMFLRSSSDFFAQYIEDLTIDPTVSTGYDLIVGRIKGYDLVAKYIQRQISQLESNVKQDEIHDKLPALRWTESKTAIIELGYALQAAGVFNEGTADLKQIMDFLQKVLVMDLGNSSRTFQEILFRKSGYTNFLDKLRTKLLERIDKLEDDKR